MPHTTSQTISSGALTDAFNNNTLLQYLNSRLSAEDLRRFFPPLVLEELDINTLLTQAAEFNAFLANHGSNPDDPDDPEFSADIYKQFTDNDIATTERTTVSSGLFSGGATSLSEFYFSPTLGNVSASYIPVYNKATSDSTAQVQFAVGYANFGGSGSIGNTTKTTAGNRETAALYRQFRNVILGQGTTKFTFTGNATARDDFAFIVFNRAQMREKVDPGNWELHLSGSGNGQSGIKLIDDSSSTTNTTINSANRVFNVVSGSIASGTTSIKTAASAETSTGAPGLFYPDLGVILLNTNWLTQANVKSMVFSTGTNTFGDNAKVVFNSISHSMAGAANKQGYFAARREEEISSTSYFARAHNKEFNFSSNPTYETTDSNGNRGAFTQPTFKGDPKAYITQVGLYDSNRELLAVAKLSQPVLKSFSREAIIKVKLDF
tara:strand:+ start:5335 stop:6642 length:1308 start_codon:yes stop_codon:yes gene_type:complete